MAGVRQEETYSKLFANLQKLFVISVILFVYLCCSMKFEKVYYQINTFKNGFVIELKRPYHFFHQNSTEGWQLNSGFKIGQINLSLTIYPKPLHQRNNYTFILYIFEHITFVFSRVLIAKKVTKIKYYLPYVQQSQPK